MSLFMPKKRSTKGYKAPPAFSGTSEGERKSLKRDHTSLDSTAEHEAINGTREYSVTNKVLKQREPVFIPDSQSHLHLSPTLPNARLASSLYDLALKATRLNVSSSAPMNAAKAFIEKYAQTLPLTHLGRILEEKSPLMQSPATLDIIESACPYASDLVSPILDKYWEALCKLEFGRSPNKHRQLEMQTVAPGPWKLLYRQRRNSEEARIKRAGSSLRETYQKQDCQIHQTKIINPIPVTRTARRPVVKSPLLLSSSSVTKSLSIMQKSKLEAMHSSARLQRLPPSNTATVNRAANPTSTTISSRAVQRMKGPSASYSKFGNAA